MMKKHFSDGESRHAKRLPDSFRGHGWSQTSMEHTGHYDQYQGAPLIDPQCQETLPLGILFMLASPSRVFVQIDLFIPTRPEILSTLSQGRNFKGISLEAGEMVQLGRSLPCLWSTQVQFLASLMVLWAPTRADPWALSQELALSTVRCGKTKQQDKINPKYDFEQIVFLPSKMSRIVHLTLTKHDMSCVPDLPHLV